MKNLLRLEELAQFALCLLLLISNDVPWWCYLLMLIGPDIGMLGYLVNTSVGALTYNILHHKALAVVLVIMGIPGTMENAYMELLDMGDPAINPFLAAGIIIFGHASLDRMLGYGLKFGDSFQHTHLGWIGKRSQGSSDNVRS
ncbi:MAG: DUF4260 domain-containing protein [Flavobacteriales bacterium]